MEPIMKLCYEAERNRADDCAALVMELQRDLNFKACDGADVCTPDHRCRIHRVRDSLDAMVHLLGMKADGKTSPAVPRKPPGSLTWQEHSSSIEMLYNGEEAVGQIVKNASGWSAIYFNLSGMDERKWIRSVPMAKRLARDAVETAAARGVFIAPRSPLS